MYLAQRKIVGKFNGLADFFFAMANTSYFYFFVYLFFLNIKRQKRHTLSPKVPPNNIAAQVCFEMQCLLT
jgi:hypothetical protein